MIYEAQLPRVALDGMNDTHLEELIVINAISAALAARDENAVTEGLKQLVEHTHEHFAGEEQMMIAQAFPPYPMHKGEHDRALEVLHAVVGAWSEQHNFDLLARYIDHELPRWVIHHIETMDTVTANFLAHGVSPCGAQAC